MIGVLGLDLSVRGTGVALPDGALWTFKPETHNDRRLLEIRDHVLDRVLSKGPGGRVDLVMIEGPFATRDNAGLLLLQLHGAVKVALMASRMPYLCPAPSLLKMYATGKGNANKTQVVAELVKRAGVHPDDDNQADAWWLRAMGEDLAGRPPIDLPQTHRRALNNLALPQGLN